MAVAKFDDIRPVSTDKVVVDSQFVKGGYFVIESSLSDFCTSIPQRAKNIIVGSICYSKTDNKHYQCISLPEDTTASFPWTVDNWGDVTFGGGGLLFNSIAELESFLGESPDDGLTIFLRDSNNTSNYVLGVIHNDNFFPYEGTYVEMLNGDGSAHTCYVITSKRILDVTESLCPNGKNCQHLCINHSPNVEIVTFSRDGAKSMFFSENNTQIKYLINNSDNTLLLTFPFKFEGKVITKSERTIEIRNSSDNSTQNITDSSIHVNDVICNENSRMYTDKDDNFHIISV